MRLCSKDIMGVVLAGGRGLRMGGKDKGLELYKGQPLIKYALELLQPQVGSILIVANRNLLDYEQYGYPVIQDHYSGFQGPLAGIASAFEYVLEDSGIEAIQVIPCDMPVLPGDIVSRLNQSLSISRAMAALPIYKGRPQPVVCLMKTAIKEKLLTHFDTVKNRSVISFLESVNHTKVDFSLFEGCFSNINSHRDV